MYTLQVNITNIPDTVYEDSLVPLFEKYGKIWDLRLVVDSAGKSKGFAFLKYCDGKSTVDAVNNVSCRHYSYFICFIQYSL